jgi:hypothetical protein
MTHQKGLDLATNPHTALVGVASIEIETKKRVAPGDPSGSYMMDKLLDRNIPMGPPSDVPWTRMPPPSITPMGLDQCRIELVQAWITAGAKDD